ncbi:unnamed protein product, partial [Effrenium voratum]
GWRQPCCVVRRGEEPSVFPKLPLAEFLRLQRLGSAPGAVNAQASEEEQMLQRLRLRLWAAELCCSAAERAVEAAAAHAVDQDERSLVKAEPTEDGIPVKVEAVDSVDGGVPVKVQEMGWRTEPLSAPSATLREVKAEMKSEHLEDNALGLKELAPEAVAKKEEELEPPYEDPAESKPQPATQKEAKTEQKAKTEELEVASGKQRGVKVRQEEEEDDHQETPGVARV